LIDIETQKGSTGISKTLGKDGGCRHPISQREPESDALHAGRFFVILN